MGFAKHLAWITSFVKKIWLFSMNLWGFLIFVNKGPNLLIIWIWCLSTNPANFKWMENILKNTKRVHSISSKCLQTKNGSSDPGGITPYVASWTTVINTRPTGSHSRRYLATGILFYFIFLSSDQNSLLCKQYYHHLPWLLPSSNSINASILLGKSMHQILKHCRIHTIIHSASKENFKLLATHLC